jgi:transcriptional regulator with XRE-family HTH domain
MAPRGRKPKIPPNQRPAWALRISKARAARQLSQAQLAEVLGVSQSAIGDYETGQNEPSLAVFNRLANALRVSAQCLMFGHQGFSDNAQPIEDEDPPDEARRDDEFADLIIATKEMLIAESMPADDRTVIKLARQLWREIESLDNEKLTFPERFHEVMEIRRRAIRAARRIAFDPIRH